MQVTLSLPVRTWAALDAALEFFRKAPVEVAASRRMAKACRKLHQALYRAGVRSRYVPVGVVGPGRSVLRLHVKTLVGWQALVRVTLPRGIASRIARVCLTVIRVQTDPEIGRLLDHEAEEIQAARAFLSELRRQGHPALVRVGEAGPQRQLRWDERRQEFRFADPVAWRVQQYYLSVGASCN